MDFGPAGAVGAAPPRIVDDRVRFGISADNTLRDVVVVFAGAGGAGGGGGGGGDEPPPPPPNSQRSGVNSQPGMKSGSAITLHGCAV